ncbi:hypothetical protein HD600_002529 [Microbacterium ginsengiterrae]|uniref:AB hydrolase-1 domain-containing protein n=1 Tax=Microbacterium ginsengiterrae TaxID=546115 RepID=A0A7W9CEZ4_9MICO|nr:alpha/beta hydrolase [Microbacterium ginsengiterrae]MBB5744032.1 hypothetical protein [Microbacterium ginsengiterrae]
MHGRGHHRRLFLHGAGRKGIAAWPTVDATSGTFLAFPPSSDIVRRTQQVITAMEGGPTTIYAHSIGAIPTVLAARAARTTVSLVLVEPALYDITRGESPIERHISAVTESRDQAAAGNLHGAWAILRPLMFGGPLDEDRWADEEQIAAHWTSTDVPWGHGVREAALDGIRTLVVTGGWNDEYELIAGRLADRGAEHVVIAGHGHRPQDHPHFREVAGEFECRRPEVPRR